MLGYFTVNKFQASLLNNSRKQNNCYFEFKIFSLAVVIEICFKKKIKNFSWRYLTINDLALFIKLLRQQFDSCNGE